MEATAGPRYKRAAVPATHRGGFVGLCRETPWASRRLGSLLGRRSAWWPRTMLAELDRPSETVVATVSSFGQVTVGLLLRPEFNRVLASSAASACGWPLIAHPGLN